MASKDDIISALQQELGNAVNANIHFQAEILGLRREYQSLQQKFDVLNKANTEATETAADQ